MSRLMVHLPSLRLFLVGYPKARALLDPLLFIIYVNDLEKAARDALMVEIFC